NGRVGCADAGAATRAVGAARVRPDRTARARRRLVGGDRAARAVGAGLLERGRACVTHGGAFALATDAVDAVPGVGGARSRCHADAAVGDLAVGGRIARLSLRAPVEARAAVGAVEHGRAVAVARARVGDAGPTAADARQAIGR